MGKRGPAPRGEYSGKSGVLSTRIRPDTRAKLVEAAEANGRSLSQEIEHRLRRTFIEDEKISDAFGSRQNYLIMRIVALAIQHQWNLFDARPRDKHGKPLVEWQNDPLIFDQVVKTVNKVLEAIRPPGPIVGHVINTRRGPEDASSPGGMAARDFFSHQLAAGVWKGIQEADPGLSLFEGDSEDHLAGMLKVELGELVARPALPVLSAADLLRLIDQYTADTQPPKSDNRSESDEG